MGRPFVIHDPVHGYIPLAPHERLVLDHPVTQRLRRITQTGLADYVYPEARTSRLAHSCGAMHMASRFFIAAIENATPVATERFLDDIRRIASFALPQIDDLLRPNGIPALPSARIVLSNKILQENIDNRRLIGWVECAVRFAALFHDLGHLPYSHDFERALREYAATLSENQRAANTEFMDLIEGKAPHEIIGTELATTVFKQLGGPAAGAAQVLDLAAKILTTNQDYGEPTNALGWLHSLVASDLDADRADYLLRDGRALGLDFAHYDVDRLVPYLILDHTNELGYVTAVGEHAISPLESFFLSRSRSNEVLIRHHKVAQIAAALRYATADIFAANACPTFLKDLKTISMRNVSGSPEWKDILERFETYDDAWWLQQLRTHDQNARDSRHGGTLRNALDLVLRRQPRFHSVWRRRGDLNQDQIATINSLADDTTDRLEKIRRKLQQKGILSVVHEFKPYTKIKEGKNKDESLIHVRTTKGALEPASKFSPVFAAIDSAWKGDFHMHLFAEDPTLATEDALKLIV
jgi:HD superfamily phosphohydrolase